MQRSERVVWLQRYIVCDVHDACGTRRRIAKPRKAPLQKLLPHFSKVKPKVKRRDSGGSQRYHQLVMRTLADAIMGDALSRMKSSNQSDEHFHKGEWNHCLNLD